MNNETYMRRGVTRGELLGATVAVIISVLGYWISTERRITILESEMRDMKELKLEIRTDMKEVRKDVSDIKIIVQSQANINDNKK